MGQEDTWATEFAPQAEVTCMHGWHLLLWEMKAPATSPSADLFRNALTQPQHPSHPPPSPQHLLFMTHLPQPPSSGALCN